MRVAERALHAIGMVLYVLHLHGLVMWLTRRIPKVVLYHAVDSEPGDAVQGLGNVAPHVFASHLDFYARHYRVVSMHDLARPDPPRRALVITFDDGYRSVLEHAVPQLQARDLPATIYVVPSVMTNEALIWVNELNWLARRHPLETARAFRATFESAPDGELAPEAMIEAARASYTPSRISSLLATVHGALGTDGASLAHRLGLYMSWDDLETVRATRVTIGNHTWSHPSLAGLSPDEQALDMRRGRDALDELAHWIPSLAYPFGDHDDHSAVAAVAAGHHTVCEVGGVNLPLRPRRIARTPVHAYASHARLFAAIEVVATVKGLVKAYLGRLSEGARSRS